LILSSRELKNALIAEFTNLIGMIFLIFLPSKNTKK
jgi:hypothetical protein